jgi:hypothetical protein
VNASAQIARKSAISMPLKSAHESANTEQQRRREVPPTGRPRKARRAPNKKTNTETHATMAAHP